MTIPTYVFQRGETFSIPVTDSGARAGDEALVTGKIKLAASPAYARSPGAAAGRRSRSSSTSASSASTPERSGRSAATSSCH